MRTILDFDRYPIDRPDSPEITRLVASCRSDLAATGMNNLAGLKFGCKF